MTAAQGRRELFANTIAAWSWSQGTLAVSILTLPLLTRFLSASEFGLWTQLLSLSALATVADLGMSTVFLRRITDGAGADRASILRNATAFYRVSSAVLTASLLACCLVPGGLLSPYLSRTKAPLLAALLVIVAVGVNLRFQTSTLRLLNQGRVDLERIFGAGPAITGTALSTMAAYWFGTALAVATCYAAVEVAFDVALVLVARRYSLQRHAEPAAVPTLAPWRRLWHESAAVLTIDLVPLAGLPVGMAVVGFAAGPVAAATYGLAWKAASLVRRFFTPFTESLFVSLCRATGRSKAAVVTLTARLSAMALAGGVTAAFAVVAAGGAGMRVVFGGYSNGVWVVLVLVLAETIRAMYTPFLRKIQSENGLGSLSIWFVVSMVVQVPLVILAVMQWSVLGAAAVVLACSALFEAAPVARKLSAYHRSQGHRGKPVLRQVGAVACAGACAVLLAWGRQRLGDVAVGVSLAGASVAGLLTLRQIVRYLAAARPLTNTSLAPGPWGQEA